MTYEELEQEVTKATAKRDPVRLQELQPEIAAHASPMAKPLDHYVTGLIEEFQGSFEAALSHYEQALEGYIEVGNDKWRAFVLNNIGSIHYFLGDLASAMAYFNRALEVKEQIGTSVINELNNLGAVYYNVGDFPKASEYWERMLALCLANEDENSLAGVYLNLGNLYAQMERDHDRAIDMFQRTIEIDRRIGYDHGLILALCNLALTYNTVELHDEALAAVDEALRHPFTLQNRSHHERALANKLRILVGAERFDEADAVFSSYDMLNLTDVVGRVNVHSDVAQMRASQGDLEGALPLLQRALALTEEHDLRAVSATIHLELRELAKRLGDLDLYVKHNDAYESMEESVRGKQAAVKLAMQRKERELEEERAEAQRRREILYSTLPRRIADRMIRGEDVTGDVYNSASVLFMDVVGFTSHSGTMMPQETTALLDNIFQHFDDICARHNVTKIKTIGDSYMAVAFPEESEEKRAESGHEVRMVRAALEMIRSIFTWPDGSPLQFRIGIHAGPVVAGVVGGQRLQYDVWGDGVNVASTMERNGEPGRIQVSDRFAGLLKDEAVRLVDGGMIDIKGKGSMKTYWLEETQGS